NISILVSVLLVFMSFTSCRWQLDSLPNEQGSLSFNIDSTKSIGIISLEPVAYIFSGTGPDNDFFSMEHSDPATTVEGLNAGEWTVQVDGLDENHSVILTGESLLNVVPYEETEVNIALQPLEGFGSVSFSLEWNAEYTVAPSAVATFINIEGTYTSQSFIISYPGFGECTVTGLPTGNYYVTVQLFDSGTLAMGSAWTVRVLNGITIEITALFEDLNKVGERMEITEDTFTIAWDPDPQSGVPDAYRMYFRSRGNEPWSLLSEVVPDIEPAFTITQDNLSFGIYEFAVSVVVGGVESGLHTSMDDTASPGTGWFVDWLPL
ncbi:MAG: hypothetical protein KAR21_24805, partial [Spirochaetales bacterium]|nr:hypothetical protein [Spirochaetales bacterium]